MKNEEIRRVLKSIVSFIKAIGLLSWKVTKQIILPNRQRKGNILSSILLLFVSLTDLVTCFSWGFSLPFIIRWKHYDLAAKVVRRSMLLTGCLLFLLSSFEWSYHPSLALRENSAIAQHERQPIEIVQRLTVGYHSVSLIPTHTKWTRTRTTERLCSRGGTCSNTSKIYLQNSNFRI